MKRAGTICILRAAALIIRDNKFLAAKNSSYDCYYTIGGGIRVNETSEEAVIREVLEETGCMLEIERLAFIHERFCEADKQPYHEIDFFYLMKDRIDLNISDNSHTDHRQETLHWLSLDSLAGVNLVPGFLKTRRFDNIVRTEHIISRE